MSAHVNRHVDARGVADAAVARAQRADRLVLPKRDRVGAERQLHRVVRAGERVRRIDLAPVAERLERAVAAGPPERVRVAHLVDLVVLPHPLPGELAVVETRGVDAPLEGLPARRAAADAHNAARSPIVEVGRAAFVLLVVHLLAVEVHGRVRRHVIRGRARKGVHAAERLGEGIVEISRIDAIVVIPLGSDRGEHAVAGIAA